MFYNFELSNMKTNLKDKSITLTYSMDIDKSDPTSISIEIFERATKTPVIFRDEIIKDRLVITLRDWPIPNTEYVLGIRGVNSITGEKLDRNLKTKFFFESDIVTYAKILSPTNFEKLDTVNIKLKETRLDKEHTFINSFYIEIALDSNFIDIPYKMFLNDKSEINAHLKSHGQYFLRARVQKEIEEEIMYGEWSECITFIYGDEIEGGGDPPIIDPDEPLEEPDIEPDVFEDDFEIVSSPEIGETPGSFIFEFNMPINDFMLEDIITIIKKKVK